MKSERGRPTTVEIYVLTTLHVSTSFKEANEIKLTNCNRASSRSEQMEFILKHLFELFKHNFAQEDINFFIELLRQVGSEDMRDMEKNAELFATRYRLTQLITRKIYSSLWMAMDSVARKKVLIRIYHDGHVYDEDAGMQFTQVMEKFKSKIPKNCDGLMPVIDYGIEESVPYVVYDYNNQEPCINITGTEISPDEVMPSHLKEESELWKFLNETSKAMLILHDANVIGLNINPYETFYRYRYRGGFNYQIPLLGDFTGEEMIRKFRPAAKTACHGNKCQPVVYAPELNFQNMQDAAEPVFFTKALDVWSLGVTMLHLMIKQNPYYTIGARCFQTKSKKAESVISNQEITGVWSQELKSIVCRCLRVAPWSRPTAMEILACAAENLSLRPWEKNDNAN